MKPAFIVSLLAALVLLAPKPDLSVAATDEWTQFGHDPGHTNSTTEFIPGPWHYVWQWNGANSSGQPQSGHLDVGNLVQPITGGGLVYMATSGELVALSPTDGHVVWSRSDLGSLAATPAYDAGFLYVTSGNGTLYQLDAPSGATNQTFVASGALDLAPLLVGSTVYVGDANGVLYAINTATMTEDWSYAGNSPSSTPPAYSALHNTLVYLTKDLNVHGVDASNGSAKWVVKPTPRSYQCLTNQSNDPCNVINSSGAQAENGWPVIADAHGLVFVRYRLDWNTLWTWSPFPNTNAAIRANFQSQPNQQPLYALNIDTGTQAFIPAAGNGGDGDGGYLQMGPQPVVTNQGGQEVAYVNWRNGQLDPHSNGNDGRGDDHTGEMVLDSSTVSGYAPGDLRFVSYQFFPTDEMRQLTMASNTLFYAHWLVEAAQTITNRAANLGNSPSNPIATNNEAFTIWREGPSGSQPCTFDSATRYCPNGLFSFGDTRSYPPGFYEYFNSQNGGSIAATIESNGLVLIKTDDGGLMALAGAGGPPPTPTPSTPTVTPTATNTPLPTNTPTITPTATDTPTPAPATSTPTSTPTVLPTSTPTNTPVSTFTPTPIPGSFTTSINNSADDVNQDGTSFTSNGSTVWLGTGQSTTSSYLGLRFNSVQVPHGATITSARLSVFTTTQQWLTISFSIAADATGNSAQFSSSSLPSARPLTTAHVSHSDNVRWNANTWNVLDQSASVVQEIVNRSDWQSGNSLSMILKGTGGSWGRKFITAFDGNPANAPQLTITYH